MPYPRDLPGLFFGEELLQLCRMWRRGWDVYAPHQPVAYHLWSRKHRPTLQVGGGGARRVGGTESAVWASSLRRVV